MVRPPLPEGRHADVAAPSADATEAEYRRASRVGRSTRLHRAARVKVWRVFEEYGAQLAERGLKEIDDAYRDAAALLKDDRSGLGYATVIVDEAQDMGTQTYRLIRSMVPPGADDLFIVGDGHQCIFGRNRVVLGRCGIEIRGRARKLRLNYRTTQQTWNWATGLLAGCSVDDLDGGVDDNQGIKSLTKGPEPRVRVCETRDEAGRAAAETEERALVYVAATRAKKELLAFGFGKPSPFLELGR